MRLARLLEAAIARACTSRLAVPFVRPLLPLLEDDEGVDEGGDKPDQSSSSSSSSSSSTARMEVVIAPEVVPVPGPGLEIGSGPGLAQGSGPVLSVICNRSIELPEGEVQSPPVTYWTNGGHTATTATAAVTTATTTDVDAAAFKLIESCLASNNNDSPTSAINDITNSNTTTAAAVNGRVAVAERIGGGNDNSDAAPRDLLEVGSTLLDTAFLFGFKQYSNSPPHLPHPLPPPPLLRF